MGYRYLPDIAIADVAFTAEGESLEDLFIAAARATVNVMVEDLSAIAMTKEVRVDLSHEQIDLLLFDFLSELVFFKDARLLILLPEELTISRDASVFTLHAKLRGEEVDPGKHLLKVDVKAVTLHRFEVKSTPVGWEATVVLDI